MHQFQDIGDDARRQYIDARAAFEALEAAQAQAATVRGGMYWKTVAGSDYLIRTSAGNAQKSLGPRSSDTEAMQMSFAARKADAEARVKALKATVLRHQRMNRALFVGRVPAVVIDILNMLQGQGIAEHFTVVGTHAVYAYEAAAGVRVESAAVATRDVDLLWDTRKRFKLATQLKRLDSSMLALLRKVASGRVGAGALGINKMQELQASGDPLMEAIEVLPEPLVMKHYFLLVSRQLVERDPELSTALWDSIARHRDAVAPVQASAAAARP